MAARVCETCDLAWPPAEQYQSSFGAIASRPVNETCPVCRCHTQYLLHEYPDATELLDRAVRYADFERYCDDRAIRQLNDDLESWSKHEPVRTADAT